MKAFKRTFHVPALRMKAGELGGLRDVAADVAEHVLPRLIVPPPPERDENQLPLFDVVGAPDIGTPLAAYWTRRAFIDATYLIDEIGRESIQEWLPKVFTRARSLGAMPIPMAMLSDLQTESELSAFRLSVSQADSLKFCICIPSGNLVDANLGHEFSIILDRLRLQPRECAIIVDFFDADFSFPELVAPIISGALESLQELGDWQQIIFQGTNFPEKNPADPGAQVLCPRNEWIAWRQAVHFDEMTAEHLIFGDYAADCSKMVFGGSGAPAIRHYRYTTSDHWLVVRGAKTGGDTAIMQNVCSRIVNSGHFSTATFSKADAYIQRTANNLDGPGNSTTWRQVNTTHHITRVVVDVANVLGIQIAEIPAERNQEQSKLWTESTTT